MARRVWSERFITRNTPGMGNYTCPGGKRMVIMTVAAVCASSGPQYVEVALDGVYAFFFTFPGPGSQVMTGLRLVGYSGSLLQVNHAGGALYSSVHGYLLDDDGGAGFAAGAAGDAGMVGPEGNGLVSIDHGSIEGA